MKCSRTIKNMHRAKNSGDGTKVSLRQLAKDLMHGSRGEEESELSATWRKNKKRVPKTLRERTPTKPLKGRR